MDTFLQIYIIYVDMQIDELRQRNMRSTFSRFKKWTPTTVLEMYGFLACVINIGIIKVPEIPAYWSTSWTSHIPFFSSVFSRNRFELIFWMLYVSSVPDGCIPK